MDLSNRLSCEAGSFPHCQYPQIFTARGFEALISWLESWVAWCVSLPSCSSRFICTQMWDHLVHQPLPCPPFCQLPPCLASSPPHLPASAPPTGLVEYFFSNSLVVGFPYTSIFWQFWLFFVLKFVVVFLLVV